MVKPLLEATSISVCHGDAVVLDRVSLQLRAGEVLAVVGANGAGKSSLVQALAGIVRTSHGHVLWEGRDVTACDSEHRCRMGLGQVAEGRQVFPRLTVRENLRLGAWAAPRGARWQEAMARVVGLFPILGERMAQAAGTLSGGEQQMLAIARCLMAQPRAVMLDEPSLGLAPKVVLELFEIVAALRWQGIAVLLIEQNAAAALRLADRACVLEAGRVVADGPTRQLLAGASVLESYLGRASGAPA